HCAGATGASQPASSVNAQAMYFSALNPLYPRSVSAASSLKSGSSTAVKISAGYPSTARGRSRSPDCWISSVVLQTDADDDQPSIDRPHARCGELDEMAVRIAEIDAAPSPWPV